MTAKRACIAASVAVVLLVLAPVRAHSQGNPTQNQQIAALQAQVAALQTTVAALNAKLAYATVVNGPINGVAGPHFILEGVNVHIRSGSGSTHDNNLNPLTGLGNLIIGYNERTRSATRGPRWGAYSRGRRVPPVP